MKKILVYIFFIISVFNIVIFSGCSSSSFKPTSFSSVGVWWWDDTLDNKYLKFAKNNRVTEIYYATASFDEKTADFIKRANKYDIRVYFLAGDYKWLTNPDSLHNLINAYQEYQQHYSDYPFAGIHLDIEPHQSSDFETNRIGMITALISLATILDETYPSITFDYDIPFWFDDELTISSSSGSLVTLPAYAHMINIADRIFIMSYRDSADEIYNASKEELNYAKSINKTIVLGVETGDVGDNTSFFEEGKQYMHNELDSLQKKLDLGVGISFHHIGSWKRLSK